MTHRIPEIVTRETWLEARHALLNAEKAQTRASDTLAAQRRALPAVRVEADYRFRGPHGEVGLADLFDGKGQLAIYHFMFAPGWEEGCPICSFWADNLDGLAPHLAARDLALVMVSSAPWEALEAYRARMGWRIPWMSSAGSAFNRDLGVTLADGADYNFGTGRFPGTEAPGLSLFMRSPDGGVLHVYSTYGRGLEEVNAAYGLLDLAPKGRDEAGLPFPMAWIRRRDSY